MDFDNSYHKGKVTASADVQKAIENVARMVFFKNLENTNPEYKAIVTEIASNSDQEHYDTIGNLSPAEFKDEGKAMTYGSIKEGHRTTIKNLTATNGFAITLEAYQDEKWGITTKVKSAELLRTMLNKKEVTCADVWNKVDTNISADGKAYAAIDHPLLNSTETNNNLVTGDFSLDTYKEAFKRFNHWKNHAGDKFPTKPTAIYLNPDYQLQLMEMLQSTLLPYTQDNTINATPSLRAVFNSYLDADKVHMVDENITTAVLQTRTPLEVGSEQDSGKTWNVRVYAMERYNAGMINPGFGFVTIKKGA